MLTYSFPVETNVHYAIRQKITVSRAGEITLKLSGTQQWIAFIDNDYFCDGPARFALTHMEYTRQKLVLEAGEHVLAVLLHYFDVPNRMYDHRMPAFFHCSCDDEGVTLSSIRCHRLSGYDPVNNVRITEMQGFMEWCDTRIDPEGWTEPDFDDSGWKTPPSENRRLFENEAGPLTRTSLDISSNIIAEGLLSEEFGYDTNFIQALVCMRRLEKLTNPPNGIWRRYDLGTVRLGRPVFTLRLPEGAKVDVVVSEYLNQGRAHPFISLSGGRSCNMYHYTARGGVQSLMPAGALGGRYVELHIVCRPDQLAEIEVLSEGYEWRTFYGEPVGAFECDSKLLSDIWTIGANTLRSCSEDVITDCPVRERGQWTGDAAAVGMLTAACTYGDIKIMRRSLLQGTYYINENGVLPAVFPGHLYYFIPFSLFWVCGCDDYYKNTADMELLRLIYPHALRFIEYFASHFDLSDGVLKDKNGEAVNIGFLDWGYDHLQPGMLIPFVCFYHRALKSFHRIQSHLGYNTADTQKQIDAVAELLKKAASPPWEQIGYHSCALLLREGMLSRDQKPGCIEYIKGFIGSCFPCDRSAPRLYSPTIIDNRVITPFFSNFAFDALIRNGEMKFVADRIKECWGFMLEIGLTTCLEVFDTRWSHCHQFSSCPTWMLSRYVLGLEKDFYLGKNHFTLDLAPGDVNSAKGFIPLADGGGADISWKKSNGSIIYSVTAEKADIFINYKGNTYSLAASDTLQLII